MVERHEPLVHRPSAMNARRKRSRRPFRRRTADAVRPWLASHFVLAGLLMLAGCGGAVADRAVSGDELRGGSSAGAEATADSGDQRIATINSEPSSPASVESPPVDAMSATPDTSARQPDTSPRHEGDDDVRVLPEDVSTGPVLEWSEIELAFPRGLGLWATSDGRVAAAGAQFADGFLSGAPRLPVGGSSYLLVTGDGADWTRLSLPEELFPFSVDMSGDHVALSGAPVSASGVPDSEIDIGVPIFVSADAGRTWTQPTLDIQAAREELGGDLTAEVYQGVVYVSGSRTLAAAHGHVRLNVESLLIDAGLVAADARFAGWEPYGDSLLVWLDNGDGTETELSFPLDALALTDSQQDMLRNEPDDPRADSRVFLFGGSGSELAHTATFDGWPTAASGGAEGSSGSSCPAARATVLSFLSTASHGAPIRLIVRRRLTCFASTPSTPTAPCGPPRVRRHSIQLHHRHPMAARSTAEVTANRLISQRTCRASTSCTASPPGPQGWW